MRMGKVFVARALVASVRHHLVSPSKNPRRIRAGGATGRARNRTIIRASMALQVGSRPGPYEILAPIGTGGMGEVYKARDTRLDRTVAIKVLPERVSANPDLKARFEREARALSGFQHPHICTLYDVGRQDGGAAAVH